MKELYSLNVRTLLSKDCLPSDHQVFFKMALDNVSIPAECDGIIHVFNPKLDVYSRQSKRLHQL